MFLGEFEKIPVGLKPILHAGFDGTAQAARQQSGIHAAHSMNAPTHSCCEP
jgi:hypothetical protein